MNKIAFLFVNFYLNLSFLLVYQNATYLVNNNNNLRDWSHRVSVFFYSRGFTFLFYH